MDNKDEQLLRAQRSDNKTETEFAVYLSNQPTDEPQATHGGPAEMGSEIAVPHYQSREGLCVEGGQSSTGTIAGASLRDQCAH